MQTTTPTAVLITGNTYPVKEQIKALGGTWNAAAKGWIVPHDKAEQVRALVDSAPAGYVQRQTLTDRTRHGSHYARFQGGGEWFQNKRGRCEDAPCCGCCS